MTSFLVKVNSGLLATEKVSIGVILGVMALLLTLGVAFRYILGAPFVWSESVSKLLIVWLTFVGTSVAFAEKQHITVDSVIAAMPRSIRSVVHTLVLVLSIVILGAMAFLGYEYCQTVASSTSPILGISLAWFAYAMPIFFVFSVFHLMVNAVVECSFNAFETDMENV
ncbi:TRAP transporter small permease [Halomonas sp. H33-56]|uniref:TRAP transporter small permease protein n=1 Tax=Halomonas sp. RT37 TaxID=2950872 RepID=A0AAU7KJX9_9GAMM|tara:strand:- start:2926 stop:3429 length:504 start_codon:yes stop_codon:yes gene_type:complete